VPADRGFGNYSGRHPTGSPRGFARVGRAGVVVLKPIPTGTGPAGRSRTLYVPRAAPGDIFPARHDMETRSKAEIVEKRQWEKFTSYYEPAFYDFAAINDPYFGRQAGAKLAEVRRHYRGGTVLDLCCGAGHFAFALGGEMERIVGVDFSRKMVRAARQRAAEEGLENLDFLVANARRVPLASDSVSLVYCFAALHVIPFADEVVRETARVLLPGGTAVLDFGVVWSLNTIVSRAMTETAQPCYLPLGRIRKMLRQADLSMVSHRSFQILPLWGNRPRWMLPLLLPFWKRLMCPLVGGRMVDEWISSLPGVRRFAFRHLIVARKAP